MRPTPSYDLEAICKLKDSIEAAKARHDDGIYKIVPLNSRESTNIIAKTFFDEGYDVSVYPTNKQDYYGFDISWGG